MRILVTNDDGIHAPGLAALSLALSGRGHEVVVVAPREDGTGSGAGIGPVHRSLTVPVERIRLHAGETMAFAVDGPPALCVFAACLGALGEPPGLVVSGINAGPNVGGSILHSGTVAGPLTGANLGITGLAVSIASLAPDHWSTAARLAVETVSWMETAPRGTVVNLNVPDRRLSELKGIRPAALAPLDRLLATTLEERCGELEMRLIPRHSVDDPDSDARLLVEGFATVTVLGSITQYSPVIAADAARFVNARLSV